MADYIKIHNFGPVKDAEIELTKLLIIIGSQGTGKSTIAKLVSICFDMTFWRDIVMQNDPMPRFSKMGLASYFNSGSSFDFKFGVIQISFSRKKFSINIESIPKSEYEAVVTMMINSQAEYEFVRRGGNPIPPQEQNQFITDFKRQCCLAFYVPAERNLAAMFDSMIANVVLHNIPLPKVQLEYMAQFEKARNYFPEFDADFLGVRYKRNAKAEQIEIEGKKKLMLKDCSSGVQSALPMLMSISYASKETKTGIYVVEEPEQNLFPTNQRAVLNFLLSHLNAQQGAQMILNTHSPYILSSLNVCIIAAKLAKEDQWADEVAAIVPKEYQIDSNDVQVYALGGEDVYCKSVMNPKTGLISDNFIDSVSDIVSADFNKLYRLYLKTLQ